MQGTQRGITVSRSSEGVAAQQIFASLHECKGSTLQLHVLKIKYVKLRKEAHSSYYSRHSMTVNPMVVVFPQGETHRCNS